MITAVPKDQNPAMPMPKCKKGQRRLRPERGKIWIVNSGSDILVVCISTVYRHKQWDYVNLAGRGGKAKIRWVGKPSTQTLVYDELKQHHRDLL